MAHSMRFLAREIRYFLFAAVFALLLVPALLWGIDWLLGMQAPDGPGSVLAGYREFYAAAGETVTWLWLLSPYLLFLLMRLLIRVMQSGGATDIGRAAGKGEVGEVESLVEAGADINAANSTGQTPLYLAAASGNGEMVSGLLEDGAELDVPDSGDGLRALHVAAQHGHTDVVDLLVRYGADTEARTRHQQTPLHLAALHGHAGVTARLLRYHVKLDSRDADGMTAQQLAEKYGHKNVLELIEDYAKNTWPYIQISNG